MELIRSTLFWLTLLVLPNTLLAQTFSVKFVDDNDQPVQFAVLVNPNKPLTTNMIPEAPAIMDQINMQFSPLVIAVEQGRQVSFPNSDNIRHHVYSFSKAKRFETKLYANKPEAPVLFDQPGVVVLGCNIHDSMVGYIFVSPWQGTQVSNKQGIAILTSRTPPDVIEYWHPWSTDPNKVITQTIENWPSSEPLIIKLPLNPPEQKTPGKYKRFGNRWG